MTTTKPKPALEAIYEEILQAFRPSQFDYIGLRTAAVIVHALPLDMGGWVCVIGEPADGCYEWIGRRPGNFAGTLPPRYESSNQGYGSALSALRDALIVMVD